MADHAYHIARINKDKNFDGKFYFGVKSTGIFCRPSCPAPTAKEEHVVYFDTMMEALDAGFRPCLRCRPDMTTPYYTKNIEGAHMVNEALKMIYEGYLNDHSLQDLADALYISDRHLRKLFVEQIGIPPIKVAKYHKALFAKRLLLSSDLAITDVALASGFRTTRQFNDVFQQVFHTTPTIMRKHREHAEHTLTLQLNYKKPYDFHKMLSFLRYRAVKGVEVVTDDSYSHTFRTEHAKGYFTVTDNEQASCLELHIHTSNITCTMEIYHRVRRMFDLDTDFTTMNKLFADDPILQKGLDDGHVPRLPLVYEPFEHVVKAILGQQITVKAATTLAGRIVECTAIRSEHFPEGLGYFFPMPDELKNINIEGLGITTTRQQTIHTVVDAILDMRVSLRYNQSFEAFHKAFSALKGIGDWTVNYVAMRGLGMVDSFPAKDLGVIKALTKDGHTPTQKEILAMAEDWRPYRAYATLCLWAIASKKE